MGNHGLKCLYFRPKTQFFGLFCEWRVTPRSSYQCPKNGSQAVLMRFKGFREVLGQCREKIIVGEEIFGKQPILKVKCVSRKHCVCSRIFLPRMASSRRTHTTGCGLVSDGQDALFVADSYHTIRFSPRVFFRHPFSRAAATDPCAQSF
jgi:hypothetical protein